MLRFDRKQYDSVKHLSLKKKKKQSKSKIYGNTGLSQEKSHNLVFESTKSIQSQQKERNNKNQKGNKI